MSYVPGFKYDVFLSYRQIDNEYGWVTRLDETLCTMLRERARPRPGEPEWQYEVFRDHREISGHRPFEDEIRQAATSAAVLVIVMSENYLDTDSQWCDRERQLFFAQDSGDAPINRRVFVVRKSPVHESRWPSELKVYTGYKFWEKDKETGVEQPMSFDFSATGRVPTLCQQLGEDVWETLYELRKARLAVPRSKVVVPPPSPPPLPSPQPPTDFVLRIGAESTGEGSYPIEVEGESGEKICAQMRMPFEGLELQNYLQGLEIARLKSGTPAYRDSSVGGLAQVRKFGARLFDTLLGGVIGECFQAARRRAKAEERRLPIRLSIMDPTLATLPWEFMFDPIQEDYLALSRQTPLVRYLEVADKPTPCKVLRPLRILALASSPRDAALAQLDVAREQQRINDALAELCKQRAVEIHWLSINRVAELQRVLNNGPWHVFHFVGHGGYDERQSEGTLLLQDDAGQPLHLSASKLAQLLHDHFSLRLVVLNACETGLGDPMSLYSSTAARLVQRGVPAVVAMQYPISDQAGTIFAARFYDMLATGGDVDEALTEARKAVNIQLNNSIEWATPMLVTSSQDGQLFKIDQQRRNLAEDKVGDEVEVDEEDEVDPPPYDWRQAELPVTVLVACAGAGLRQRLNGMKSVFNRPLPVFYAGSDQDHFKTDQSFRFEWRDVDPANLGHELDVFLSQDRSRLAVIVSDQFVDSAPNGKRVASQLVCGLRERLAGTRFHGGLVGIVSDKESRVPDVDRTVHGPQLSAEGLRKLITKVADGLRLKAPPGPTIRLAGNEAIMVRLAQTQEEIEECLTLRFQVYDTMGYLESGFANCGSELDSYDLKSLHFLAMNQANDIVGTARLIMARPFGSAESPDSIVGKSPRETQRRQAELVRAVANSRGGYLREKINLPPPFMSLPILQSTEFEAKIKTILDQSDIAAELSRLVVAPRYRGVGVSRLLVRSVIATTLSLQKNLLLLECIPAHVKMYQDHGFERISGTHTRAQDLDQEAVAMYLDAKAESPNSRFRGLAENDLKMLRKGFGESDAAMLFGSKHLCLCGNKGCWGSGMYASVRRIDCPLQDLHAKR